MGVWSSLQSQLQKTPIGNIFIFKLCFNSEMRDQVSECQCYQCSPNVSRTEPIPTFLFFLMPFPFFRRFLRMMILMLSLLVEILFSTWKLSLDRALRVILF